MSWIRLFLKDDFRSIIAGGKMLRFWTHWKTTNDYKQLPSVNIMNTLYNIN